MPSTKTRTVVITIDGPAGAGKSTVAKELARRLGYAYLDTGAMYRALTLKALRLKVNLESEDDLVALAQKTTLDLVTDKNNKLKVIIDGEDVSESIRTLEVTNNTFYIARAPRVRAIMVDWQRKIGAKNNIVVEGRDTGTVVFPAATCKFYLDADFEERCQRRINELRAKGTPLDEEALKSDLKARDQKDLNRPVGPLKKADDAHYLDTTHMAPQGVVEKLLGYINHG